MRSISTRAVLGVAGKYCSGKNALTAILVKLGFHVIDLDQIGHHVLELKAQRKRVIECFGSSVVNRDGKISRKALGKLVFKDAQALKRLEEIVHPEMIARVKSQLKTYEGNVVINAAVLFKMGLHRLCDLVICVEAPFLRRLFRAMRRDGLSIFQSLRKILFQRRICPKSNANGVDIYYVKNKKGLMQMQERVLKILWEKGIK